MAKIDHVYRHSFKWKDPLSKWKSSVNMVYEHDIDGQYNSKSIYPNVYGYPEQREEISL